MITCTDCKKTIDYNQRKLCKNCWQKVESKQLFHIDGKWSKYGDMCIDCNTNSRPHHGRGRCQRCWIRQWRKTRKEAQQKAVQRDSSHVSTP